VADVELQLELYGPDRVFRPGDPISGRVRVTTTTASADRPLVVVASWQTTGEGEVDRGDTQVVELAAASETISSTTFPFTFPAPHGPLTYSGKTFSLAWRVEARLGASDRAAVAHGQDIVIEADPDAPVAGIAAAQLLWLAGGNSTTYGDGMGAVSPERVDRLLVDKQAFDRRAQPTQLGCLSIFVGAGLLGFLAFPVIMIAEWLGAGDAGSRYGVTMVLVLTLLLVVALQALLAVERRIERNLGLTIRITDGIVRPGGDLVCLIGVDPNRQVSIAGAEICVTAEEASTSSSPAEASTTKRVELFRSTIVVSPARVFPAGMSEEMTVRVPLPRDAAASFESRYHGVEWQARVSVKLSRRTAIDRTLAFVVYPNGRTLGRRRDPRTEERPLSLE
jgi:hypothetical protein